MPLLSRHRVPALLRQADGKPHASDDDHEPSSDPPTRATRTTRQKQLPTPTSSGSNVRSSGSGSKERRVETEEDIYAEPISDGDEKPECKQPSATPRPISPQKEKPGFKTVAQLDGSVSEKKESPAFKVPSAASPPQSAGSKRSFNGTGVAENENCDSDNEIFSSSQPKKRKTDSHTSNLFAPPRSSQTGGYGSEAKRKKSREQKQKAKEFKRAQELEEKAAKERKPVFQLPKAVDSTSASEPKANFRKPRTRSQQQELHCDAPNSSDLSSPPPDFDDLDEHKPPPGDNSLRTLHCAVCDTTLPATTREDFEDAFPRSKQWTYKWQQRFCTWHKRTSASQTWSDRGYPEIDWERLPARLKEQGHMQHVKRVLEGKLDSVFRDQLAERVKGGRNKTLAQVSAIVAQEDKDATEGAEDVVIDDEVIEGGLVAKKSVGGSAGYYGPRGEKVMMEHILSSFSADLRKQAAKDRLIAASGVSGGVSGFVQQVLLPELAVSIIREDLGPGSDKDAVQMLTESAEVGELLHPEAQERVRAMEDAVDGGMEQ